MSWFTTNPCPTAEFSFVFRGLPASKGSHSSSKCRMGCLIFAIALIATAIYSQLDASSLYSVPQAVIEIFTSANTNAGVIIGPNEGIVYLVHGNDTVQTAQSVPIGNVTLGEPGTGQLVHTAPATELPRCNYFDGKWVFDPKAVKTRYIPVCRNPYPVLS